MAVSPTSAVEVFYSYAHADETLRNALEKHLKTLQRQGLITQWHDRRIDAGTEWAHVIDTHLNTASLILLLISSDFIASDYCYDLETQRAMERHHAGEAHVIPIILRPCDWQATPFAALQAFPTNGKAITTWINRDEALLDVVRGIRTVLEAQIASNAQKPAHHNTPSPLVPVCNIPYTRNPFFTNREQTLKQLHSTLQTNKPPTMARALSGMCCMTSGESTRGQSSFISKHSPSGNIPWDLSILTLLKDSATWRPTIPVRGDTLRPNPCCIVRSRYGKRLLERRTLTRVGFNVSANAN